MAEKKDLFAKNQGSQHQLGRKRTFFLNLRMKNTRIYK